MGQSGNIEHTDTKFDEVINHLDFSFCCLHETGFLIYIRIVIIIKVEIEFESFSPASVNFFIKQ